MVEKIGNNFGNEPIPENKRFREIAQEAGMSMQEGLLQYRDTKNNETVSQETVYKRALTAMQQGAIAGATGAIISSLTNQKNEEKTHFTKNEKKEWIKQYRAENNCSKKEAKRAFEAKYELNVMTHKEAKEWIKNYIEQTGCSKKEAKNAFEEQHGYKVPLNNFQKTMSFFLLPMAMMTSAKSVPPDSTSLIATPPHATIKLY